MPINAKDTVSVKFELIDWHWFQVPTPKKRYYPTETTELNTYLDQDCQKEVNSLEVRPILGEVRRS
jgi:hypothetical protein